MISHFISSVVEKIANEFQGKIERCKPLAGYIETTEISAIHAETPGMFITSVGCGETTPVETGEVDTIVHMVAYIIVVTPDSLKRETAIQKLVSNMLTFVSGNRWGLPNIYPASEVESADLHGLAKGFKPDVSSWRSGVSVLARASDLYGGSDPISNLALWAVTWEQKLRMGQQIEENNMIIPNDVNSRFDSQVEKVV